MGVKQICSVQWMRREDGRVTLAMSNDITGACLVKTYKNERAAKCAATKFNNRMMRNYGTYGANDAG